MENYGSMKYLYKNTCSVLILLHTFALHLIKEVQKQRNEFEYIHYQCCDYCEEH